MISSENNLLVETISDKELEYLRARESEEDFAFDRLAGYEFAFDKPVKVEDLLKIL